MGIQEKPSSRRRVGIIVLAAAAVTFHAEDASAQQPTFHLDRLEVPGAPDDGVAIFRPVVNQRPNLFGQLGIGYQFRPLRTSNITTEEETIKRSHSYIIQNQFAVYANAGFQFLDRVTLGVAFPWYPYENGANPSYTSGSTVPAIAGGRTTTVTTSGPGAGDLRLDLRGVIARSDDRKSAFGAGVHIFAPTGTTSNFGSDGKASGEIMVTAETQVKYFVFTANTGIHFRPRNSINDPFSKDGLGIGNEWRWALGAFLPLRDGKYRLGATVFGQTGIESDPTIGSTAFTSQNSPIEIDGEGRMRFGESDHWWFGASGGTALLRGYGAPDLRIVALLGAYVPILDSEAKSPEPKHVIREQQRRDRPDRDGDGIPDDVDACPDQPEDHLGNDPNDGCPLPPDRDGDGIPDQFDKCPDQPEDKDGIDDGDGCPEDDADSDGVPDTVDACPKMPGKPNPDPKKNGCPTFIVEEAGGIIKVLQQVHFAFGTAQILPESFPILQEVADYLRANPSIKRMAIEGHTDNRGAADLNKKLSGDRAASVMNWLVGHGIVAGRLEAHGYGMEQPIEDNNTDAGRAKNRRVEFKILQQDDTNKVSQ